MNKRHRDEQGRAIRWIDTRHGKLRLAQLRLMRHAIVMGISSAAMMQIDAIRGAPAKTPEDKAGKAMAIAEVIILSHQRLNSAAQAANFAGALKE